RCEAPKLPPCHPVVLGRVARTTLPDAAPEPRPVSQVHRCVVGPCVERAGEWVTLRVVHFPGERHGLPVRLVRLKTLHPAPPTQGKTYVLHTHSNPRQRFPHGLLARVRVTRPPGLHGTRHLNPVVSRRAGHTPVRFGPRPTVRAKREVDWFSRNLRDTPAT